MRPYWVGGRVDLPAFERPMLTLLEWEYAESERKDASAPDFRS